MLPDALNRFDRTLAILILLQSRKRVRAQDVAERYGVSLRTVYRDIKSLEAAGVPIIGEAGSGYSIMEGYRLPPVMFTKEEAVSFVAAEKLMQKFMDAGLGAHFRSAMSKVKSVLKGEEKDWISVLENQVWAEPVGELFNKEVPRALEVLFTSIAARKQVLLHYQSLAAERPSERYIEPVGVFHEANRWYLLAYCHLRKEYRQFRTDRIHAIRETEIPFTRTHGTIDDHRKKLHSEICATQTRVVIVVKKEILPFMNDTKKYYGFVSQEAQGDEVELTFLTQGPMKGLARWYLMFGDSARVIEPLAFAALVRELTEKTRQNLAAGSLELVAVV